MKKLKIGVLVSGSGSNLQSIIDKIEQGALSAEISIVICNNPQAFALERCAKHKIPFQLLSPKEFPDRMDFDMKMAEILKGHGVELVVMAGFMRVLSPEFLSEFPLKVINIHPALLPSFPGLHGQKQAFDYGVKFSGCTVHFADSGVDTGPIIIQAVVPVFDNDTEEIMSARILKEEHRIYPQAIQLYAEGKLEIRGRKVIFKGDSPDAFTGALTGIALHNPPLKDF
jgi:phosphoribosylglycinamide formyltransferase-1